MRWDHAGEHGLRVTLAETPTAEVTRQLLQLGDAVQSQLGEAITDAVIGYTTLTLFFDPSVTTREHVIAALGRCADKLSLDDNDNQPVTSQLITLPVYYGTDSGEDLLPLARLSGLSIDEVIALHSGCDYTAYATGFAPGFCYLGEIPESIAAPRLSSPRRYVPAGSVAIADRQTAVYPRPSPGGWRLIGRCPLPLFDASQTPPNRIQVGDRVRFEPISRTQFLELGGSL